MARRLSVRPVCTSRRRLQKNSWRQRPPVDDWPNCKHRADPLLGLVGVAESTSRPPRIALHAPENAGRAPRLRSQERRHLLGSGGPSSGDKRVPALFHAGETPVSVFLLGCAVTVLDDRGCTGTQDLCLSWTYDSNGNNLSRHEDDGCDGTPDRCITTTYGEWATATRDPTHGHRAPAEPLAGRAPGSGRPQSSAKGLTSGHEWQVRRDYPGVGKPAQHRDLHWV